MTIVQSFERSAEGDMKTGFSGAVEGNVLKGNAEREGGQARPFEATMPSVVDTSGASGAKAGRGCQPATNSRPNHIRDRVRFA